MAWGLVAVIGGDKDALKVIQDGLRQFPAEHIYLLSNEANRRNAEAIARSLEKVSAPCQVIETEFKMESLFSTVSEIKRNAGEKLVVNIESDYTTSCLMLSAAFVNGIQAIGLANGEVMAYPVMKFSYYTAISDKKQRILQMIMLEKTVDSLERISREIGMSLPLVTYHVRGTREKPGLEELGLVATKNNGRNVSVSLTPLGKLIAKGYIEQCKECPSPKQEKIAKAMRISKSRL